MNTVSKSTSMQVYPTHDYFLFKPIEGNRGINQLHLSRLKKSIEKDYLFTIIIVNENYEIIDGQHRFIILKELNLPLNYIICDGYGLNEVHILNQNSKTWGVDDYVNGYCNMKKQAYIDYKWFKLKYGFGHNECMAMLTGNESNGGTTMNYFKLGEFKITNMRGACETAEMLQLVGEVYDGFQRRSFVYAILSLIKKPQFVFSEFLQKARLRPTALKDCAGKEQYIELIEEVYNYRRRDKVNLRY